MIVGVLLSVYSCRVGCYCLRSDKSCCPLWKYSLLVHDLISHSELLKVYEPIFFLSFYLSVSLHSFIIRIFMFKHFNFLGTLTFLVISVPVEKPFGGRFCYLWREQRVRTFNTLNLRTWEPVVKETVTWKRRDDQEE